MIKPRPAISFTISSLRLKIRLSYNTNLILNMFLTPVANRQYFNLYVEPANYFHFSAVKSLYTQ